MSRSSARQQFVDWAVESAAAPGEAASGDLHFVAPLASSVLLAVIDGLGHGADARAAAETAAAELAAAAEQPLATVFEHCHAVLRHTRGVVMTVASLGLAGQLTWLGVGNVEGVLVRGECSPTHVTLPLRGGIVGRKLPPLRVYTAALQPRDLLVLATDGIRQGFAESVDPAGSAESIAAGLVATHARGDDDALALVVRYRG